MSDTSFKILACFLVFIVGAIGGLFSLTLLDSKNSRSFFSLGNSFAAGVFLAAGLLHMLPDANEGFKQFGDFPWAFLGCAIGFITILFLEKVVLEGHNAVEKSIKKHDKNHEHLLSFHLYVLTIILSVHSIIAGIALGTENDLSHSLVILFAILAHKGSAAFALSVNLLKEKALKRTIIRILTIFCFMTPFGIILGLLINSLMSGPRQQIITALFDSLAAGTFLYVSILGITHEEFSDNKNKLLKFAFMCLGIAIMAVVAIWT